MKRSVILLAALAVAILGQARDWDFSVVSDADRALLDADTGAWSYDASGQRWCWQRVVAKAPLEASGSELEIAHGLLLTTLKADNVRVDTKKKSLTLNGKGAALTIPDLKAGQTVTVECQSSSSSTARTLEPTNLAPLSGFENSTGRVSKVGTVEADGDVTLVATGGMYVYSVSVTDGAPGPGPGDDTPSAAGAHAVKMHPDSAQMLVSLSDGQVKAYHASDIARVDFDRSTGAVEVASSDAAWSDRFESGVDSLEFAVPVAVPQGTLGNVDKAYAPIRDHGGWIESLYAEWTLPQGADGQADPGVSYRVMVRSVSGGDFEYVDRELVRSYGTYGRVDVPGLRAGLYDLKVIPVRDGQELPAQQAEISGIEVMAHDRSGFAWKGMEQIGIGAYKADGTLKDGAKVIYVTAETAKTVKASIFYDKGYKEFTGLQSIINALQKGHAKEPLCVRVLGCVDAGDMDALLSNEGLQVKGKNNSIPMNLTIEGVGRDATLRGFGMLLRNAASVELRNFAVMLCMDDCVSLDTDNLHCWVHHLDLFYGGTGSDADQAKGDGSIDIKSDSQFITVASCRFHDCGKTSLCGMKSESGPNYIDYHHNWFDHSDSRHPRVRTMSVHVWNNYYDGCAKYGVGNTSGGSVFAESNFFRGSRCPILINHQGTDAKGSGTFDDADGGVVKSFGNIYSDRASGSYLPVTQAVSAADFDCYEARTRDEKVPAAFKSKAGGHVYDNFDTDPSLMHSYRADRALDVPRIVTGHFGAGRCQHGDFTWDFSYPGADADYSVIVPLKQALGAYTSALRGIFP